VDRALGKFQADNAGVTQSVGATPYSSQLSGQTSRVAIAAVFPDAKIRGCDDAFLIIRCWGI